MIPKFIEYTIVKWDLNSMNYNLGHKCTLSGAACRKLLIVLISPAAAARMSTSGSPIWDRLINLILVSISTSLSSI